jgi:predicted Zn-dependent peptidase
VSEYKINDTKNGLRTISCKMPGMESVAVGIWVGIGGRYEEKNLQGISHFVEHLLFKGTKKRNSEEISQAIEGLGGHINAYTSEEFTCYMVKIRGKHQGYALEVLLDMIGNSLFDKDEIEKERHVIMEESHMILDHPGHYIGELVHELMWPNHPLGRMLVGTDKTITSIKREDIIGFHKVNYAISNMLISIAGNVDEKRLLDDAKRYTSKLPLGEKPAAPSFMSEQNEANIKIIEKPTEQIHVCIGMHGVPREDPDRYTLKLLSIILGENMSSRLFQTVREKHGLCYEISTGLSYFKDTGGFVISSGVKPNHLDKYISLVIKELKKIKTDYVSSGELKRAKEFYEGQLVLGFEKTMTKMLWMGEFLMSTGKVPSKKEVLEDIRKVSVKDIIRLSERIFNGNNLNVAIIGPVGKNTKLELSL